MKPFSELTEQELLALAISSEDDDARTYTTFANALRERFPASALVFSDMAEEEHEHRRRLTEAYRQKFGDFIPLIRRDDVTGFVKHKPAWLMQHMGVEFDPPARRGAWNSRIIASTARPPNAAPIPPSASSSSIWPPPRRSMDRLPTGSRRKHLTPDALTAEGEAQRRLFLLQVIQPGLVGLMDGSVSTLAPLFAAAFATHDTWQTFLVGTAASLGAGISMGLAEGLSDDGKLTGRGHPLIRGLATGIMTTVGGLGHALPYLIPRFLDRHGRSRSIIVFIELWAISWIRYRYMDTPFLRAAARSLSAGCWSSSPES